MMLSFEKQVEIGYDSRHDGKFMTAFTLLQFLNQLLD